MIKDYKDFDRRAKKSEVTLDVIEVYWNKLNYSKSNFNLFESIPVKIVKVFKKWELTLTKLRQYYQVIVNLYNSYMKMKKFDVDELKTEFNILLAKINYDIKRQGSKVPQAVYDFIKFNRDRIFEDINNVQKVREKFIVFKKHFETVVAYSVGELRNN